MATSAGPGADLNHDHYFGNVSQLLLPYKLDTAPPRTSQSVFRRWPDLPDDNVHDRLAGVPALGSKARTVTSSERQAAFASVAITWAGCHQFGAQSGLVRNADAPGTFHDWASVRRRGG